MLCVCPRERGLWVHTLAWAGYFIPLHQFPLSKGIGWLWELMTVLNTFWARDRAGAQCVESRWGVCVCTVCGPHNPNFRKPGLSRLPGPQGCPGTGMPGHVSRTQG